ncbi:hypothetical protein TNCV_598221 [Trichonephila clavipes]|nr:hypothetical protein TNCV_598221 [Trichonephila clavipes]
MSVIAHQTEKEWISVNKKSSQRMSQTQAEAQQNNMQPDLRMHICEPIIRVLQHQKDVNQKQHICVKHDFVGVHYQAEKPGLNVLLAYGFPRLMNTHFKRELQKFHTPTENQPYVKLRRIVTIDNLRASLK